VSSAYRIGIIGAGHIGKAHAAAWQAHPRCEVVSIADVQPERAAAAASEHGIPEALPDYLAMLGRPELDVVAVCTPPFAHCEPALAALAAGKHVVCEKPFTLNVTEAEQMVEAARTAGRFLTMCSSRLRYQAAALRAHDLVLSGELGHVYHARSSQFRQRGRPGIDILQDASWFLSQARAGGGALIDIGVYEIDLMLWLMGNPRVTSVSAAMFHGIGDPALEGVVQDVEDHCALFCQMEGGASLTIEIAWASHLAGHNTRFILGDRGGLQFNPLTLTTPPVPGSRECPQGRVLEQDDTTGGGLPGIVGGMVAALEGGPPPMTPAEDALAVTKVIDAAYRSAASGVAVAV
jgi:predicted dehydrogenase